MKRQVISWMLIGVLCLLTGCTQQEEKKNNRTYQVYYLALDGMSLETESFASENKVTEDLVNELMNRLENAPQGGTKISAKPAQVKVLGVEVEEDQLTISFDSKYEEISTVKDVLCRAAYVSTLTQIAGIDFVKFEVEGQPLKDATGEEVGAMKGSDFVSDLGKDLDLYQSQEATLYYSALDGQHLIPVKTELAFRMDSSYEKMIIEALLDGPGADVPGGYATLPKQTQLVSVYTDERICYVSFDDGFLQPMADVSEKITLYSVVNSLCSLPTVDSVQITINGETTHSLTDVLKLDKPYTADKSLITQ